jgi:invasion protein IalB
VALLASVMAIAPALSQTQDTLPAGKKAFGPRVQKSQQNAQKPRKSAGEVVATFDDWKVECQRPREAKAAPEGQDETAAGAGTSGKSDSMAAEATPEASTGTPRRECGMIQTARNEKLPQIGLTLVVARIKRGEETSTQMRVMAPIGVFLPTGVALEIDGAAVSRVPFSRCLPQVCLALAEASPETIEKLRKGTVANFIIYDRPGAGMPIKISLKGFGKALATLDEF